MTLAVSENGTQKSVAGTHERNIEPWEVVAGRIRTRVANQQADLTAAGKIVLGYFNARMKTQFRWGGKSSEKIIARLRETQSASMLFYAVDGATKDDNIMGRRADNPQGYKRPVTVFRDTEQVDRFLELAGTRAEVHPVLDEMVRGAQP